MHSWVAVAAKAGQGVPRHVIDLLRSSRSQLCAFPVAGHDTWSSDDGRVRLAGWWSDVAWQGQGGYWHRGPTDVTAFSGHVWLDVEPWHASATVVAQLAGRCRALPIAREADRLSGVFTAVHLRDDGSGWATADPLGLGLLYRAETPEVVVLANRAELAAVVACERGAQPGRDIEAMGLLGYTGSFQRDRTGFESVRTLPQGSVVSFDPVLGARVDQRTPMPWVGDAPVALEEAVRVCLDRLRARVRLLAAPAGPRPTLELTGGKDSRLVLALLLAEGIAHDFEYRTWGVRSSPDAEVSMMLAEHYGLDHGVGGEPITRRTRRRSEPGPPADGGSWRARAIGYEAQVRHQVWASSGALSIWDLQLPTWPPEADPRVSGLGGEGLRTNYPRTGHLATDRQLERFIARGGFGFDSARLLADEAAEHLRGLVAGEIRSLLPVGGDPRDAIDGFYLRGRLRRWAGSFLEGGPRARVLPLYDLSALRVAFGIGGDLRRDELLHLHLMETCDPALARMPFAGDGWARGVLRGRPDRQDLPLESRRPRFPVSVELAAIPARRRIARSRHPIVLGLVRARQPHAGAAEVRRMDGIDDKRVVLRSLLDLPRGHPTWDLYDKRRTIDALDRIDVLPTQARMELHHATTVATWLDHGERRADLFERTAG